MSKRCMVFAGQGSQFAGMGRDLVERYPECKHIYAQADEVLGYSLSRICFEGPDEELTKTNHCQPAIFVTSAACLKALELELGSLPDVGAMAGLSLGEWSALYAAGSLTFEDTVRVLEARGRFMQEACDATDGGMLSLMGLSVDQAQALATEQEMEISNINGEGQVVLSGPKNKLAAVEQAALAAGAKRALALTVAGAYHSRLMQPAAERLAAFLAEIPLAAPQVPVVSNVTALPHGAPDDIRAAMVDQVTKTVRWLDCVRWLGAQGISEFVECGPGKVLSGLIKRIDRSAAILHIQDIDSLEKTVAVLRG